MEPLLGTSAPKTLGDRAHILAGQIYHRSEQCLMAHSIRAVQSFLEENGKGRHWITITIGKPKRYLGRRAIAIINPDDTEIVVAEDIGFENQRLGIAHELAHLLMAKLAPFDEVKQEVREAGVTARAIIEGACSIFEKDLCMRHHGFYANAENRMKLLFPSLDGKIGPTA